MKIVQTLKGERMSEKRFNCVLGKDYHIINNNVDDMTYFLQDGNDVVLVINLLNRLVEENEQLDKENKKLQEEIEELKRERDSWKSSTCSYMNKDSLLSMDCQIVQEALWELEKEIEFGSKREDLFFDLKEKFEKLNNHRIGVL